LICYHATYRQALTFLFLLIVPYRATEDITWEDPLQRFDGADDVGLFLGMLKHFTGWKFNIRSEVHSAHEILVDWDITVLI
jgi:hypothetical protein